MSIKFSQLTVSPNLTAGDIIPIVRNGANYTVDASSVKSYVTSDTLYQSGSALNSIQPLNGNNLASGNYSFIAGGSANNTNGFSNTFILGSNISASQANFTYVNNLSVQGALQSSQVLGTGNEIVISDGTSDIGNGANTLTINALSGVFVNSSKGIVLKDSNNASWSLTVSTSGTLVITAI
jgi:hypothetical protein